MPAKVLVLLTDKFVTSVTAPLNTAAPVMVKPLVPPAIPLVVIVLPVSVRSPLRLTVSLNSCVQLVVILLAKVLVPLTDKLVTPVTGPLKIAAPVMVRP